MPRDVIYIAVRERTTILPWPADAVTPSSSRAAICNRTRKECFHESHDNSNGSQPDG